MGHHLPVPMVVAKLEVPPPPCAVDLAQLDWEGERVPLLLMQEGIASSHVHLRQRGHVVSRLHPLLPLNPLRGSSLVLVDL